VRSILQEARLVGIDSQALCRGLGFSPDDLDAPGFMVSHFEAIVVVRRAVSAIANPLLGLELGMRSNFANRGALALGLLASATLGDAVRLMLRYPASAGLLVALNEETTDNQHALLATSLFESQDIEPFLVDKLFAGLVRMCRQGTAADYSPIAVELVRHRPADVRPYEAFFRCAVRFGSPHNRLVSDVRWMAQALPTANAMSVRYAEELLAGEASQANESAVGLAVARVMRQALPQTASSAELASSLHLSERTLRRRLMEAGLSYRTMQDDGRKLRAISLVQNGQMDLTAVALQTGFADLSNFRRAFKRWTGTTPTEMRGRPT
jgi:AraC-like DNA-binding protein